MEIKSYKDITIEGCDIELPDLVFEAYWMYSFTPGKTTGPPEDCSPEDWDHEVTCICIDREIDRYIETIRPLLVKKIKDKCCDLEFDGYPKKWAEESAKMAAQDRAEAQYQDAMDRGEWI